MLRRARAILGGVNGAQAPAERHPQKAACDVWQIELPSAGVCMRQWVSGAARMAERPEDCLEQ
eukprot:3583857-Alexandrium_andersonii.AAC.1